MAEIRRLTSEEYHSDTRSETPTLSASIAHTLVSRSPAHAWLYHPRLGGKQREATRSMDRGTLIDALLLGNGREIVSVDAADWRTKAAREHRDSLREAGAIPVLRHELEEAVAVVAAIRKRLAEFGIVLDGEHQLAVFWTETADDGTEVPCRGLLDHWKDTASTIIDLKTSKSAHPRACQSHMVGYGYDIQSAAYTRAIEQVFPERAGRIDFLFLFCEVEEPYLVTPVRRMGTMRELGERRWRRAVNLWAECMRTNKWPGYVTDVIGIEAPIWALAAETEQVGENDWSNYVRQDGPSRDVERPGNGVDDGKPEWEEYDKIF